VNGFGYTARTIRTSPPYGNPPAKARPGPSGVLFEILKLAVFSFLPNTAANRPADEGPLWGRVTTGAPPGFLEEVRGAANVVEPHVRTGVISRTLGAAFRPFPTSLPFG